MSKDRRNDLGGGRLQIESKGRFRDLPDAGWDQLGSAVQGAADGPLLA